ncbi:3'-5' exonuclease [Paenibacillus bovis]|uniref:Nuclease n=1 Tax=Paenibacillus bovis TaxID=1616788 RepID=A0A172ZJL0_9BACL|nr:NERD domain-containing protein/DEAD/DEAH box helicase [Paenibacillus bovis]ANF97310.1 nuclease [Paenibacillus bovis]
MAYMIPETIRGSATAGERTLFNTFKKHLPDDYVVYYEPHINGRRPDYVIIGPDLGLLVLEVKDYTENTLYQLTPEEWQLHTQKGTGTLETIINPISQARNYSFHIQKKLKKDRSLLQQTGIYSNNLKFRYGHGVVFTRMKETHIIRNEIHRCIDMHLLLTREEIDAEDEHFDRDRLLERLNGMFPVAFHRNQMLSEEDMKAIRYHLFPEVRISADIRDRSYYQDDLLLSLNNIQAMDLHQESLARQIGDRHRLIRGVAGSGKTLILASRARTLLHEHPDWRILVLCYGSPLSCNIRSMIMHKLNEPEDLFEWSEMESESSGDTRDDRWPEQMEITTFHDWLYRRFPIKFSKGELGNERQINNLLEQISAGTLTAPQYDAILVDEGQDLEPQWLELISKALNPETQSLLIVEDKAQKIFRRKVSLSRNTGLDFRGRSKVLSINYRNTAQIVNYAWDFYRSHSKLRDKFQTTITTSEPAEIIPPQGTKRRGPEPLSRHCASIQEEMQWVVEQMQHLHETKKVNYTDMAILYRVKGSYNNNYIIDAIRQGLDQSQIPYNWFTENKRTKDSFDRYEETVKISTIDSAKGMDFRTVFIVNVDGMPREKAKEEEWDEEVSRFYIGMTRAMEYLYLSYSRVEGFAKWVEEKADRAADQGENAQ